MFHIKFELHFGRDGRGKQDSMDKQSDADFIAATNEQGRTNEALQLAKRATQAQRFGALQAEINKRIAESVNECNNHENVGKVFVLSVEDNKTHISRIDRDGEVGATFNASKYTVRFKSTTLVALNHAIEVRMNGQNPYLVEGEGQQERNITNERIIDVLVSKAIRALR